MLPMISAWSRISYACLQNKNHHWTSSSKSFKEKIFSELFTTC